MRTRISPRLIVAALLVAVGCARGGPAPLSDADKSAIRANDQKFAQGVMAKDWAAVAAMYTTDASFMPPNESLVKGREAIQTWMTGFPPVSAFTLEPLEVEGVGDLSYVRGTYSMSFTPPGAPGPIQDHGKYIVVNRKQPDGSWIITNDIFNSDVPTTPAK